MQFTVQCDAVSNVLLQLGMAIKRKKMPLLAYCRMGTLCVCI